MAVLRKHVEQIEQMKFGKYAKYSALAGFANSKAGVMIIRAAMIVMCRKKWDMIFM